MNGAYLMLVPDRLVIKMIDFVRKNDVFIFRSEDFDDVFIFRSEDFKEVYQDILNECSVAKASVDADGCLGQG